MNLDLLSILLLVSTINGLLFFLISLIPNKNRKRNYYHSALLLLISLMLFDEFTRWTPDFFTSFSELTFVTTFSWFLIIPCIYLLIRNQVTMESLKWYDIFHLVPLLIENIIGESYFSLTSQKKKSLLTDYFSNTEPHVAKLLFAIQIVIYLYLIYMLLKKKYKYSPIELFSRMKLWLKSIYIILFLYLLSIVVIIFSVEILQFHLRSLDITKTFLFLFLLYGWLLYIIYDPKSLEHPIRTIRIWNNKYNFDSLSSQLIEIINSLNENKLFLKEDVSISDISLKTNISGRQITKLVNKELSITVPQLISLLRIKEMEKR